MTTASGDRWETPQEPRRKHAHTTGGYPSSGLVEVTFAVAITVDDGYVMIPGAGDKHETNADSPPPAMLCEQDPA